MLGLSLLRSTCCKAFTRFDAWAVRNPKLAAGATGVVLGGGGDACAQLLVEHRSYEEYDGRRTLGVVVFLGTYVPTIQYTMYTRILDPCITVARFGRATPAVKAVADSLMCTPAVYVPCYYFTTLSVRGRDFEMIKATLRREWLKSCIAGCKIWMPANVVTFMLPSYLRIPFMSVVSFFWQMRLALISNRVAIKPVIV